MTPYPVHLSLERAPRFTRVQLLVRLVVLAVLGMLGLSFGTVLGFAFVVLPVYAAIRLASLGSSRDYFCQDGRRLIKVLHWFASVSAWAGLVAERLPAHRPEETVSFTIEDTSAQSSSGSAMLRIITGLPSALVLMILGCIGVLVWLWAVLSILFTERVGQGAFEYLVGLQRWSVRLLAYQACLVDAYPPFSFSDTEPTQPEVEAIA